MSLTTISDTGINSCQKTLFNEFLLKGSLPIGSQSDMEFAPHAPRSATCVFLFCPGRTSFQWHLILASVRHFINKGRNPLPLTDIFIVFYSKTDFGSLCCQPDGCACYFFQNYCEVWSKLACFSCNCKQLTTSAMLCPDGMSQDEMMTSLSFWDLETVDRCV